MEIFISQDYEAMCSLALAHIAEITSNLKRPLICPASGDTPAGLYKKLVSEVILKKINVENWLYVGLDEWMGMNGDKEGSCRFHLNHQLFEPLHVQEHQISFFDGTTTDPINECEKAENFIYKNGGIDVAIVGIGLNGHVGMNEPGTSSNMRTHVTEIHTETQISGQKYFKENQQLAHGITLGIANILEARTVILLASGKNKASIIKQVLEGEMSVKYPSGLLRNHANFYIYLDKEAASLLQI